MGSSSAFDSAPHFERHRNAQGATAVYVMFDSHFSGRLLLNKQWLCISVGAQTKSMQRCYSSMSFNVYIYIYIYMNIHISQRERKRDTP